MNFPNYCGLKYPFLFKVHDILKMNIILACLLLKKNLFSVYILKHELDCYNKFEF